MSVWRRKAIECLPEQQKEFEKPSTSIYGVFFELLPALREAHRHNNNEKISKIYAFAEWCLGQKDQELSNATAVAFYEHLGDYDDTFLVMPKWVNRDTYERIRVLLDLRLTSEKMKLLDAMYYGKSKTK